MRATSERRHAEPVAEGDGRGVMPLSPGQQDCLEISLWKVSACSKELATQEAHGAKHTVQVSWLACWVVVCISQAAFGGVDNSPRRSDGVKKFDGRKSRSLLNLGP